MRVSNVVLCFLALAPMTTAGGCATGRPAPLLVDEQPGAAVPAVDWKKEVGDVLKPAGGLSATLNEKQRVYTVTVPRDDLTVAIDGMPVPVAAGLASTFHFYLCSCGKMSVLGEFIVADFEANDVVDALRAGAIVRVTSIGQIAIGDRPHLLSVRFHGEGEAPELAKRIKEAMRWTGEERMKPAKE